MTLLLGFNLIVTLFTLCYENDHLRRISVDRLKKLKRGGGVDETVPTAPLKTLETASGVFTKYYTAIAACPFRFTRVVPLKKYLSVFAEILDDLHVVIDHILSRRSLTDQLKNSANLETLFGCILASANGSDSDHDLERMTSALLKIALRTDPAHVLVK